MRSSDTYTPRKIILEDGSVYHGYGFGSMEDRKLELVFNTSMVGYQEIITDPSYTDQAIVMTYPVIGNYGINHDDCESGSVIGGVTVGVKNGPGAIIVRDYTEEASNFRSAKTLSEYMSDHGIAGVCGPDTREITRKIRDLGSCKVMITAEEVPDKDAVDELHEWRYATDQVSRVSTKEITEIPSGGDELYHVAAIDCGIKNNILRDLRNLGCRVTLVPYDTPASVIERLSPDGIFISNGPGDPTDVVQTINTVKRLHGRYPIFGICLGHQILSLSYGAQTYKLKFGHRGGNHPVKDLESGKVDITSQNHSYAVDTGSLAGTGLMVTHINLLDDTVEGIRHASDPSFGIQYHPESSPGPNDSTHLFDRFIKMMKEV